MGRLTMMYITNSPEKATQALDAGVDRIFVDLEKLGKHERQRGLDTVKSDHSISDVVVLHEALPDAEIIVRISPIGGPSQHEVEYVIRAGVVLIMVPMFTASEELEALIVLVRGRARI